MKSFPISCRYAQIVQYSINPLLQCKYSQSLQVKLATFSQCFLVNTSKAVSYTHLDVYKRQSIDKPETLINKLKIVQKYFQISE